MVELQAVTRLLPMAPDVSQAFMDAINDDFQTQATNFFPGGPGLQAPTLPQMAATLQQGRAAFTDNLIQQTRAAIPPQVRAALEEKRRRPRITLREINQLSDQAVADGMRPFDAFDSRPGIVRFLDWVDLPRNSVVNIAVGNPTPSSFFGGLASTAGAGAAVGAIATGGVLGPLSLAGAVGGGIIGAGAYTIAAGIAALTNRLGGEEVFFDPDREFRDGAFGLPVIFGSDILNALGVESRVARAVFGFAGDVALDPLTYLSAGGNVIKVVGQGGTKFALSRGVQFLVKDVEKFVLQTGRLPTKADDPLLAQFNHLFETTIDINQRVYDLGVGAKRNTLERILAAAKDNQEALRAGRLSRKQFVKNNGSIAAALRKGIGFWATVDAELLAVAGKTSRAAAANKAALTRDLVRRYIAKSEIQFAFPFAGFIANRLRRPLQGHSGSVPIGRIGKTAQIRKALGETELGFAERVARESDVTLKRAQAELAEHVDGVFLRKLVGVPSAQAASILPNDLAPLASITSDGYAHVNLSEISTERARSLIGKEGWSLNKTGDPDIVGMDDWRIDRLRDIIDRLDRTAPHMRALKLQERAANDIVAKRAAQEVALDLEGFDGALAPKLLRAAKDDLLIKEARAIRSISEFEEALEPSTFDFLDAAAGATTPMTRGEVLTSYTGPSGFIRRILGRGGRTDARLEELHQKVARVTNEHDFASQMMRAQLLPLARRLAKMNPEGDGPANAWARLLAQTSRLTEELHALETAKNQILNPTRTDLSPLVTLGLPPEAGRTAFKPVRVPFEPEPELLKEAGEIVTFERTIKGAQKETVGILFESPIDRAIFLARTPAETKGTSAIQRARAKEALRYVVRVLNMRPKEVRALHADMIARLETQISVGRPLGEGVPTKTAGTAVGGATEGVRIQIHIRRGSPEAASFGPIPIDQDSLPDIIYHVTEQTRAIKKSGIIKGTEGFATSGLGGGSGKGISFTRTREEAIVILRDKRRTIELVNVSTPEEAIVILRRIAEEDDAISLAATGERSLPGPGTIALQKTLRRIEEDLAGMRAVQKTPQEMADHVTKAFHRTYLIERQIGGGSKDPLFLGSAQSFRAGDIKGLAILGIRRADIPREALIVKGADAGEIRVLADIPARRAIFLGESEESARRFILNEPRELFVPTSLIAETRESMTVVPRVGDRFGLFPMELSEATRRRVNTIQGYIDSTQKQRDRMFDMSKEAARFQRTITEADQMAEASVAAADDVVAPLQREIRTIEESMPYRIMERAANLQRDVRDSTGIGVRHTLANEAVRQLRITTTNEAMILQRKMFQRFNDDVELLNKRFGGEINPDDLNMAVFGRIHELALQTGKRGFLPDDPILSRLEAIRNNPQFIGPDGGNTLLSSPEIDRIAKSWFSTMEFFREIETSLGILPMDFNPKWFYAPTSLTKAAQKAIRAEKVALGESQMGIAASRRVTIQQPFVYRKTTNRMVYYVKTVDPETGAIGQERRWIFVGDSINVLRKGAKNLTDKQREFKLWRERHLGKHPEERLPGDLWDEGRVGGVREGERWMPEQYISSPFFLNEHRHEFEQLVGAYAGNIFETDFLIQVTARTFQHTQALAADNFRKAVTPFIRVMPQGQFQQLRQGVSAGTKVVDGIEMRQVNMAAIRDTKVRLPIQDVPEGFVQLWPEDMANQLEKFARAFQSDEELSSFLKGVDTVTNYWKTAVLALPRWWVVNMVGGAVLSTLAGSKPASWIKLWGELQDGVRQVHGMTLKGKVGKFSETKTITVGDEVLSVNDLMVQALGDGIANMGRTAQEILPVMRSGMPEKGFLQSIFDGRAPFGLKWLGHWYKFNAVTDDMWRMVTWVDLRNQGVSRSEATNLVLKHLFDYGDLTRVEQQWGLRVFPFYRWIRNNIALQVKTTMRRPAYASAFPKLLNGIEEALIEEDPIPLELRPRFYQEALAVQIAQNPEKAKFFLLSTLTPAQELFEIGQAAMGGEGFANMMKYTMSASNPLLKNAYEIAFGEDLFTGRDIGSEGPGGEKLYEHLFHQTGLPYELFDRVLGEFREGDVAAGVIRFIIGGRFQQKEMDKFLRQKRFEAGESITQLRFAIRRAVKEERDEDAERLALRYVATYRQMYDLGIRDIVPKLLRAVFMRQDTLRKQELANAG